MEKVYETIACEKVHSKDISQFLDLVRFYSAPHLQSTVYLKYETEYVSILNRTSLFSKSVHTVDIDNVAVSTLSDTDSTIVKMLKDTVPPVTTIINGTKFESGGHQVRVIDSSHVTGDVDGILQALGCR